MAEITPTSLAHLAKLARLRLDPDEATVLLADLKKFLDHFAELVTLSTDGVVPVAGGTDLKNVFREDAPGVKLFPAEELRDAFPEERDGFLVVPPVFE